jgi:hypothetical protein
MVFKFEARNPKLETNSNDESRKISNKTVPDSRFGIFRD